MQQIHAAFILISGFAAVQVSDKTVNANQVPLVLISVFRLIVLAKVYHIFIDIPTHPRNIEGIRSFQSHGWNKPREVSLSIAGLILMLDEVAGNLYFTFTSPDTETKHSNYVLKLIQSLANICFVVLFNHVLPCSHLEMHLCHSVTLERKGEREREYA